MQPRRPYNSNWLTEFTQQNKQRMDGQNVMALQLYGQPENQQSTYQPQNQPYDYGGQPSNQYSYGDSDLMSRYLKDNSKNNQYGAPMGNAISNAANQSSGGIIGGAANQYANNSGAINAAANQMGAQNDYTDFTDEGGETFKIKKQPKPAYDWSMDFG
jgi:hypothetical protein